VHGVVWRFLMFAFPPRGYSLFFPRFRLWCTSTPLSASHNVAFEALPPNLFLVFLPVTLEDLSFSIGITPPPPSCVMVWRNCLPPVPFFSLLPLFSFSLPISGSYSCHDSFHRAHPDFTKGHFPESAPGCFWVSLFSSMVRSPCTTPRF